MHKQDFVHMRALIEECCEKDQTIRDLKDLLSKAHASYDSLTEEISYERGQRRGLESDCDTYITALSNCRAEKRSLNETIDLLRKENLELRNGPKPSNEEVIAILRDQLSEIKKTNYSSPKITCIKTARELMRSGLKEAKDLVESMPEFQSNRYQVTGLASDYNENKK